MKKLLDCLGKTRKIAVGLMSGTSIDGVDTCLLSIEGSGKDTKVEIIDFITENFSKEERQEILNLCSPETSDVSDICRMNVYLGRKFGLAAKKIIEKNSLNSKDVDFISSHGQTIYHMPNKNATLQIGELSEIATITGCLTIGDFRPSDMSVNGQGAPLVPLVDYILFSDDNTNRIMMNIGGISNLTVLEAGKRIEDVTAFDCGPGNMLIDRALSIITDGELKYDESGKFASKGKVNEELLNHLLKEDDFIYKEPPKSTGREKYNEEFINQLLKYKEEKNINFEDFIATITAYTYKSIAINLEKYIVNGNKDYEIYVGGGGAKNAAILNGIRKSTGLKVFTMEDINFDSDAKEAVAFAVLGNEFLAGHANNLKHVTGASKDVLMGKLAFPPLDN